MSVALFSSQCLLLKDAKIIPENLKEKSRELSVGVGCFIVAIKSN